MATEREMEGYRKLDCHDNCPGCGGACVGDDDELPDGPCECCPSECKKMHGVK